MYKRYRAKVEALVQIRVKPLEEKGEKPLRVSQALAWQVNSHAKDVLFEGQYHKAKATGECPKTKAAVLIDGNGYDWSRPMMELEPAHQRVLRKSGIEPPSGFTTFGIPMEREPSKPVSMYSVW